MSQIAAAAQHGPVSVASPPVARAAQAPAPSQRPAFVVSIASLVASQPPQVNQTALDRGDSSPADSETDAHRPVQGVDVTA